MIPKYYKFAYKYSSLGWIGSSKLWKIYDFFYSRPGKYELIKLPNGMPLIYDHNDWTSRTIFEGTYERELLNLLKNFCSHGTYVDAGANLGATLWNAMLNSPKEANWIAFEPSARCFNQLESVCNDIDREGNLHPIGLSNVSGMATLSGSNSLEHSGKGSLREIDSIYEDQILVNVKKLDEIYSEYNSDLSISLLKIDTEGHEGEVLEGAKFLIINGKIDSFVIEISPMFGSIKYLTELNEHLPMGYVWLEIKEFGLFRKVPKLVTTDAQECIRRLDQFNLLITKDPSKFKSRYKLLPTQY